MPLLLLVILASNHYSTALSARNRLSEATSSATRQASIAGVTSQAEIEDLVKLHFGETTKPCTAIRVTEAPLVEGGEIPRLDVKVVCELPPPFGIEIFDRVSPISRVSARVVMPLLHEEEI